ncbi:MAG: hypothetical protein KBT28_10795 [Bacteroidales bacterium]|nr:hypothetical protein [Candidatus Colimorpha merdihippi]
MTQSQIEQKVKKAEELCIRATSAEQELCNIAQEKMEAILSVIAHSSNINPEAVIISWQASDGFIFTDGDWEYCPTHDELVELLSMKGGEE